MTVKEFFRSLAKDLDGLSAKCGVPKYSLQKFARENHIPSSYIVIFTIEADIARIEMPLQLFSALYAPREKRLAKLKKSRKLGSSLFLRMLGL
ncbi:hypothetical protein [uncultured Pelagimonas sp.]|uniref:hypothetical protein n=1 Tax=uncultured Pelagimonas sp. TaxID=1618102 RepID=UPI00261918DD|nr:hypothetical protein [uncultured Pelagimonas sp.]